MRVFNCTAALFGSIVLKSNLAHPLGRLRQNRSPFCSACSILLYPGCSYSLKWRLPRKSVINDMARTLSLHTNITEVIEMHALGLCKGV